MFIMWGWRCKYKQEGETSIECRTCYGEMLFIYSEQQWFTLFCIPVFPISCKEYYFQCLSCKYAYEIGNDVNIALLIKHAEDDTEKDEY